MFIILEPSTKVYIYIYIYIYIYCAYTICLYGRIEISCTFPSGSPWRPRRVSPYTPSVLICCIHFLCDWSFRLCHRKFSTLASAECLLLMVEWQQVFSSFQDSSQYSVRSQHAVVWIASTRRLISKSSSSFTNPLVTVTRTPITISCSSFFNSQARFSYLFFFSIIIIANTHWEFFKLALGDGFSLEFEWQQVSSSLQDSSQYSGRS